jgi:pyruvate,water dikinase
LQFTRQTDMLMVSDASMDAMVACFLSGAPCFDPATFGGQPVQEAS